MQLGNVKEEFCTQNARNQFLKNVPITKTSRKEPQKTLKRYLFAIQPARSTIRWRQKKRNVKLDTFLWKTLTVYIVNQMPFSNCNRSPIGEIMLKGFCIAFSCLLLLDKISDMSVMKPIITSKHLRAKLLWPSHGKAQKHICTRGGDSLIMRLQKWTFAETHTKWSW